MNIKMMKESVKKHEELSKARRVVQRAFGVRRGHHHFEYLD